MTKKQIVYAPEFRQQMVELHLAGRSLNELAREFGCGSSTIGHWVKAAGARGAVAALATPVNPSEREELIGLRKRVRQLETERDILSKATAWFANNGAPTPTSSTR
jgi:transposase